MGGGVTITYADINSLYPYAYLKEMPCGGGRWRAPEWCQAATRAEAAAGGEPSPSLRAFFWFVECTLRVPRDVEVPVLGEHKETASSKKLVFDNTDKQRYVLFSEQLHYAMARGVEVVEVHRALAFDRSPVLASYCRLWREQKELQDEYKSAGDPRYNEAMRAITKLLLN